MAGRVTAAAPAALAAPTISPRLLTRVLVLLAICGAPFVVGADILAWWPRICQACSIVPVRLRRTCPLWACALAGFVWAAGLTVGGSARASGRATTSRVTAGSHADA